MAHLGPRLRWFRSVVFPEMEYLHCFVSGDVLEMEGNRDLEFREHLRSKSFGSSFKRDDPSSQSKELTIEMP